MRTTHLILSVLMLALVAAPAAADNQGFIYGRVTTESGTEYEGFLRWGKQEAFWDDIFHSMKTELPYADVAMDYIEDHYDERDRKSRGGEMKVFRWKIEWEDDGYSCLLYTSDAADEVVPV